MKQEGKEVEGKSLVVVLDSESSGLQYYRLHSPGNFVGCGWTGAGLAPSLKAPT